VKAPKDQILDLKPDLALNMHIGDKICGYNVGSAIQFINSASVRDLKNRVSKKYTADEMKEIEMDDLVFRPNLLIDTDKPYEEDDFAEVRVGSCFIRSSGPCRRCKAICIQNSKPEYNLNLEPNPELA